MKREPFENLADENVLQQAVVADIARLELGGQGVISRSVLSIGGAGKRL